MYECPVYKTRSRGPTYIWTFNLKTKERPSKWVKIIKSLILPFLNLFSSQVLAGVAVLLQT